jgi:hypothetical protein
MNPLYVSIDSRLSYLEGRCTLNFDDYTKLNEEIGSLCKEMGKNQSIGVVEMLAVQILMGRFDRLPERVQINYKIKREREESDALKNKFNSLRF